MSKMSKLQDEALEKVAGGAGISQNSWATVGSLQSSTLAMRTQPAYDYSNAMPGCDLNNGDKVQIKGAPVVGADGRRYVMVYSPTSGKTGYVNASFLNF